MAILISLDQRRAAKDAQRVVRVSSYQEAKTLVEEDLDNCRLLLVYGWVAMLIRSALIATVVVPVMFFWIILFSYSSTIEISHFVGAKNTLIAAWFIWFSAFLASCILGPGPQAKIHAEIDRLANLFQALNFNRDPIRKDVL